MTVSLGVLIGIYFWVIVAATVFALPLSFLGAQFAARRKSMQTICVSQGAMFGVLTGLAVLTLLHVEEADHHFLPFLLGFAAAGLTSWVTDALLRRMKVSEGAAFVAVFAALLAASHLVTGLVPAVESHMAHVYFGDLATLGDGITWLTLGIGLASICVIGGFWKGIVNRSFERAILNKSGGDQAFDLLSLALLVYAVQYVGFLFTLAILFVPTVFLSLSGEGGVRRHLILSGAVAAASTAIGFTLSLLYSRLPTVPTIVAVLVVTSLAWLLFERGISGLRGQEKRPPQAMAL